MIFKENVKILLSTCLDHTFVLQLCQSHIPFCTVHVTFGKAAEISLIKLIRFWWPGYKLHNWHSTCSVTATFGISPLDRHWKISWDRKYKEYTSAYRKVNIGLVGRRSGAGKKKRQTARKPTLSISWAVIIVVWSPSWFSCKRDLILSFSLIVTLQFTWHWPWHCGVAEKFHFRVEGAKVANTVSAGCVISYPCMHV